MEKNNPPREGLVRALGECPQLVREDSGGMPTLHGHFAVWDRWTEINSAFEGHFMEKFSPSSMTKTMSEGRERMRVLFQHGRDPQIGDKPLGPISRLEPDDFGASYSVPMLDTAYNRELIPGLEAGLYGASFRFEVLTEEFDNKPARSESNPNGLPERVVTEARVREFGPVTFPAYADATAGLRSLTDEFMLGRLLDDPERLTELLEAEKKSRTFFYPPTTSSTFFYPPTTSSTFFYPPTTSSTNTITEPDPPEDTTPPEPEPPEATTQLPVKRTREEWLEWITKS